MATRLWGGRSGDRFPARERNFSYSPNRSDQIWNPPSLLFSAYRGSSQGINRPGRDVNHLQPSSAERKNKWSCASAVPVVLRGVDRDDFCNTL